MIRFEKWEGLGNDFVVVDEAALAGPLDALRVRNLCDRRRGVGADGVLVVSRDPARMVVHNADGSRPEMCGNGLRCVAAFLSGGRAGAMVIATDSGERRCDVAPAGPDLAEVTVDMGVARAAGRLEVEAHGRRHAFDRVDCGNPHAITFERFAEEEIDRVGPVVAVVPAGGTNVEFCRLTEDGAVEVVVWERGVGRTLACGTGACAVAAVACSTGLAPWDEPLEVRLPGGALIVTVTRAARALTMRGPARRVFVGELGSGW